MLQGVHSAILSTFIKLQFVIRSLFCLFLSGRFIQVLLHEVGSGLSHDDGSKLKLAEEGLCLMLVFYGHTTVQLMLHLRSDFLWVRGLFICVVFFGYVLDLCIVMLFLMPFLVLQSSC